MSQLGEVKMTDAPPQNETHV
jgi:Domain of unknown function (DUF4939)